MNNLHFFKKTNLNNSDKTGKSSASNTLETAKTQVSANQIDTTDTDNLNFSSEMVNDLKENFQKTKRNTKINKNSLANPPQISPQTSALNETLLIESNTRVSRRKAVLYMQYH
jgi:hypothetical protein